MGQYSSYNIVRGLELVILFYLVLSIALLGLLSLQLYRSLQEQDSSLAKGAATNIRSHVLLIAKRAILWVFGYKGESRENTSFSKVDIKWVDRYTSSIIFRLIPVYGLYILSMVILTRPIFLDGNAYRVFSYSQSLPDLFIMFAIYVSSNIFFDYLSLRFTFSCLMRTLATKRYIFYFIKSAAFALLLFLLSQVVSCILWIYKRQDPGFPKFESGIFRNFFEIMLWPYAFVTGPASTEITSELFPGQLLITGVVFIPTILVVSLFIIFSSFLKSAEYVKKLLLSHKLDRFCRVLIKVKLLDIFGSPKKLEKFGYCNLALLILLDLSFVSVVGAVVARIF